MVVVHHAGYALEWTETQGDGARWWAVWIVHHLNLGVPMFFVISGYCIAASAEATIDRGESAGSFLAPRVWRIYPPYWFALLGFLLMVAGLDAAGLARLLQRAARRQARPSPRARWVAVAGQHHAHRDVASSFHWTATTSVHGNRMVTLF